MAMGDTKSIIISPHLREGGREGGGEGLVMQSWSYLRG